MQVAIDSRNRVTVRVQEIFTTFLVARMRIIVRSSNLEASAIDAGLRDFRVIGIEP